MYNFRYIMHMFVFELMFISMFKCILVYLIYICELFKYTFEIYIYIKCTIHICLLCILMIFPITDKSQIK